MNGVVNVFKEKGFTSHDVVAVLRGMFGGLRVGHTGTLDPGAEGVLPVCVGRATKLAGYFSGADKAYRAELVLGVRTDTLDLDGAVLGSAGYDFSEGEIRGVVESFVGEYMQTPPMYSAVKVKGKKLYELARKGQIVEREPRLVKIYGIQVAFEDDGIWLHVECSKGTYIRSLCADIGERLGCGGCMGRLLRTASGGFVVEKSLRLSEIRRLYDSGNCCSFLIPPELALPAPCGNVVGSATAALNGNPLPLKCCSLEDLEEGERCWLYHDSALLGLYTLVGGMLKPEVMIHENN